MWPPSSFLSDTDKGLNAQDPTDKNCHKTWVLHLSPRPAGCVTIWWQTWRGSESNKWQTAWLGYIPFPGDVHTCVHTHAEIMLTSNPSHWFVTGSLSPLLIIIIKGKLVNLTITHRSIFIVFCYKILDKCKYVNNIYTLISYEWTDSNFTCISRKIVLALLSKACMCRSPVASAPSMWEWGVWVRFLNSIVFLCLICFPSTLPKVVSYVCSLLSLPRESCFLYSVHAWSYNSLLSSRQSHLYRIDLPSFLSTDIRWCCYKTFRVFVFVLVIVATNIAKIILWRSSVAHM